ncbi:MAG: acyltransferase family protein [Actinomycetota bacterium]|nr:acyltransferase family protein [Actinomycetota bacterium]
MPDAEVIRIDAHKSSGAAEERSPRVRCAATTSTGRPCRNLASPGSTYCHIHTYQSAARPQGRVTAAARDLAGRDDLDPEDPVQKARDFIRRRMAGDYELDDFGYDRDLAREVLLPLAKPLYENYFRVKTLGITRIPNTGPALLVGNHSGTVAIDAVMMQYAVATEHPAERAVRNIGADLVFSLPFIGPLARKTGNALAHDDDALELLRRGELVGVFPEGFKGVGKGWRERYKLQRFGRGGFIEVALRARVPIIPVAFVGAEETYPMIGNARFLASALRVPYFPITPTFPWLGPLGLLPLPSRWVIEFGQPIPLDDYPEDAADDKMLVFDLADSIRDTIQQMLYKNLKFRGGTFF